MEFSQKPEHKSTGGTVLFAGWHSRPATVRAASTHATLMHMAATLHAHRAGV
jgi:hypothetical protein